MPKIEVTVTTTGDEEEEDRAKSPIGSVADSTDQVALIRSVPKPDRKKSVIGNMEGNRFKNFKTFVESKILSKSDRSLELEPIPPSNSGGSLSAGLASGGQGVGNGKLNGSAAVGGLEVVKKDNLQRRRSHLSMYEIEMTVRKKTTNKHSSSFSFLCNFNIALELNQKLLQL